MLELKNVCKYYNTENNVTVGLRNINLSFSKNEIVAIVGSSGSGKSTLLNVISGIDTYEEGEMYFKGEETSYYNQDDMDLYRKNNVAFIFQNYNIIDSYTVLDNVIAPMILKNIDYSVAKERAVALIEKVGLSHRINNRGVNLSGGEKQRCVIARALATDCEILACDEPTGNLDSKTGKEIIQLLKEVSKDKLVLIVTHNFDEIKDIATRTIKISDGEVVEDYNNCTIESSSEEKEKTFVSNVSLKNQFRIIFENIKNTPRKSFFTFIVFMFISIVSFYLYLSCVGSSQISVYNPDSAFENYEPNRIIAFNYDHTRIDDEIINDIDGEIYLNAFYEDIIFNVTIGKQKQRDIQIPVIYTKHNLQYTHLQGETLGDSYAAYLIIPYEQIDHYSILVSNLVGGYFDFSNHQISFVGIGYSKNINTPTVICSQDISKYVFSKTYKTLITAKMFNNVTNEEIVVARSYQNVSVPTIYMPKSYEIYDGQFSFEFMINGIYPIETPDVRISYTAGGSNVYLAVPSKFEPTFDGAYELTIYADNPIKLSKQLESAGLTVIRPSVDYVEISINHVLYLLYTVISIIIIFILYLVSYTILSKIYSFKIKDYTIFRTLGVSKQNMRFIVIVEIMLISLLANIFSIAVVYMLYNLFNIEFLNVVKFNSVQITTLSFVIAIVFSYYIANKFNKSLFKNSVNTTFKAEV